MAITYGSPYYEPGQKALYTAMRFRWRVPSLKQDGTQLNSTTQVPSSITYTIMDNHGASTANTGSLTYNSTDLTWDAQITASSTPGRYHLHFAVAKGSDSTFFHDSFLVQART